MLGPVERELDARVAGSGVPARDEVAHVRRGVDRARLDLELAFVTGGELEQAVDEMQQRRVTCRSPAASRTICVASRDSVTASAASWISVSGVWIVVDVREIGRATAGLAKVFNRVLELDMGLVELGGRSSTRFSSVAGSRALGERNRAIDAEEQSRQHELEELGLLAHCRPSGSAHDRPDLVRG